MGPGTDVTVNGAVDVRAIHSEGLVDSNSSITLNDPGELSTISAYEHGTMLDGPGDIEMGTLTWGTGFMAGTGTTTVTGHSTLTGGGIISTGRTLVTRGTGTWSGSRGQTGTAHWINSAVVTVTSGSLGATPVNTGTELLIPTFHNEPGGSITKVGASNFSLYPQMDNDGVLAKAVDATSGFYIEDAYGISSGTFDNVVMDQGVAARPARLGSGAQLKRATISGHVIIPPGETLEAEDLYINAGTLDGDGTIVLNNHTQAYFGVLGGAGTKLIQPAGATMTWTHAMNFRASRLETAGLVTVEETGLGRPETTWGHHMTWENTGEVRLQSGLFPTLPGDEGARFVNRGKLVKETTGGFTFRPRLINDGVIELLAGRLTATRLEQTPDGTLRVELRNATANSGWGALTATALRYQGRFEAVLAGGFVPAPSARFQVITSSDRSGAFGSTSLAGFALDESQASNIALVAPAARSDDAAASALAAPAAAVAPLALPALLAVDDRGVLRAGRALLLRALANDRVPAGTRVRLVDHSRFLRVRVDSRTGVLRVRLLKAPAARRALRVRYRLVAADGRRSRVATVRLRLAR
jgi:hypothetical protein